MADQWQVLDDATAMIDEIWKIKPVIQEARFGATAQHFTRRTQWKGGALHVKFVDQIYTGAKMDATLEADVPIARKISTADIQIEESHLRRISASISRTAQAQYEVDGSDHAVWDLSNELTLQLAESFGEKRNQALHSNANMRLALVAVRYDEDGTSYTGGQADAFIKIDNGSISNFHPGMMLDICAAASDTIRIRVQVNDVCHDSEFKTLSIGPGIVVTENTDDGASVTDAHLDNVVDNDVIRYAGEVNSDGYDMGIDALCNRSSPGTYFGVTRTGKGNYYLIPYGRDYSSATLDLDTHFGNFADTMGMVFEPSKRYRRNSAPALFRRNKNFRMTEAIVAIAQPALVNEVARQASEGQRRFTKEIASSMDTARRNELVAVHGWNGAVLMNPSMPPIVLQPEPLAKADTIRIFEPSTVEYISMGDGTPIWVRPPGQRSRWHQRRDTTTGNLKMVADAAAFLIEAPFCDQPRLWYSIDSVRSSLAS